MASNESRGRTKSSISRSLVVPILRPFCHFLFSYFFFFLFSEWYSKRILGISSSILAIFHRGREKRLRKWNWFWWSWLCYCVIYLCLSMCCTRRTLLDNWNHVILHWKRVIKIYVWKDCPRSEFHFYIWHDICYLHFTCRLFVSP